MEQDEVKVDDEATLDAELAKSISDVKAGKELKPETETTKPEDQEKEEPPKKEEPANDKKEEDTSKPQVSENKEGEDQFRIPNKGKFESDESYEKRIELFDLVKKRQQATTPEAKKQIVDEIKKVKGQLKTLNGSSQDINNLNTDREEDKKKDEDPTIIADKERLKALGGATKEDIQEVIRQERFVTSQTDTLADFVKRHKELGNEDIREVFFDFIDNNFKWQDKAGKDLMATLELGFESMYRPSETVQDRVLKGANVQEKVNAMQFPGNTGNKSADSAEVSSSLKELMDTGMSEEKARALISE